MARGRPELRYRISIQGLKRDLGVDRSRLSRLMRETLAVERAPEGEIAVAFVGARTIQGINREYRAIDEPTDVLSFSYLNEPHAGGILGEIYVAPSIAAPAAEKAGCSLSEEIVRLTVHGLLHVLGYEHDTPRSRRRMLRRQERYLDRHYRTSQPC